VAPEESPFGRGIHSPSTFSYSLALHDASRVGVVATVVSPKSAAPPTTTAATSFRIFGFTGISPNDLDVDAPERPCAYKSPALFGGELFLLPQHEVGVGGHLHSYFIESCLVIADVGPDTGHLLLDSSSGQIRQITICPAGMASQAEEVLVLAALAFGTSHSQFGRRSGRRAGCL
jgi:hypothetical protein